MESVNIDPTAVLKAKKNTDRPENLPVSVFVVTAASHHLLLTRAAMNGDRNRSFIDAFLFILYF